MKKIIYSVISACLSVSLLSSCSDSKNSDSVTSSKKSANTASVSSVSSESTKAPDITVTADEAEKYVKELFDAAQTVADRYSTSGGVIISTVIKNTDAPSDAEKMNICNMINGIYTHEGIWAIKIQNFKIISAVYTPYDNCGIVARYPEAFDGSTDNISSVNIDSFL